MEQNKHSQQLLQAGPLKSTLTLKLHTSYAIRLWEGRVVPNSQNDGDEKKRKWMIPSLPMFISRAGHITDDAKKGYLYAEMWLYQLEQALEQGTQTIQKLLSEVEQQLVQLPAVAVISDISSTSPVDLAIFSKSPVGYKCVWLLVGVDQLALRVLQGEHYGFISRQQRDRVLKLAGYQVRHVTGMAVNYRKYEISRLNLDLNSETYQQASRYLGEIDPDIISGKKRASFLPVLKK
ncbi:TPA: TIGR03761 family integrating conjugative element protein [Morganella morganii]|nr:TIGR03761 family integrating conjugative element protein [Morganella morganii]